METSLYIKHNPTVSGNAWEVWQANTIRGQSDILLDVFSTKQKAKKYIMKREILDV